MQGPNSKSWSDVPGSSPHSSSIHQPTRTMNPSTALRSLSRASQNALRTQRSYLGLGRTIWPTPTSILQQHAANQPIAPSIRFHSTDTPSQRPAKPLTDRSEQDAQSAKDAIAARKAEEPAYEMTFTCKKCLERSSHRITKQAYHFGTVLVTCPGCKNRHLISDHMKVGSIGVRPRSDG